MMKKISLVAGTKQSRKRYEPDHDRGRNNAVKVIKKNYSTEKTPIRHLKGQNVSAVCKREKNFQPCKINTSAEGTDDETTRDTSRAVEKKPSGHANLHQNISWQKAKARRKVGMTRAIAQGNRRLALQVEAF